MAVVFDFKKEYKDLYLPKTEPMAIEVPEMSFVAVAGSGNPNEEGGEYQSALAVLYGVQYAIKMSKKGDKAFKDYFDYVVPPLESLWWLAGKEDWAEKSKYQWLAMIRLPEFVTQEVFDWACVEVSKKKNIDTSKAQFLSIKEGLCVQMMHSGPYDDEPKTIAIMEKYIVDNGYINDVNDQRRHHEIYLSDPRKTEPSKMKTVLRIPVKNK